MKENLTINDLPNISEEERDWWNEHNDEYYHYFYRIDNLKNGKFYYGIHSQRKDSGKTPETDGYMGSGITLGKAKKKDGIENFKKTIIKTFSTRDEARFEEMKVVDEDLIKNPNCYNSVLGGGSVSINTGFVVVDYKDKSLRKNKFFLIPKDEYNKSKDKYITSSSLRHGKAAYKNKVDPSDTRWLNTDDPLVVSGEFIGTSFGKGVFKNINSDNDIRSLDLDDPLVVSGEFVGILKGIKQSKEFISNISGEKNGSYGTMWITNGNDNRKIRNNDKIPEGWRKGKIQEGHRSYRNVNTGNEKLFPINNVPKDYLPSNFFNESGNIITDEEIYKTYNKLGSWNKVYKFFKKGKKVIKEILSYFNNPYVPYP